MKKFTWSEKEGHLQDDAARLITDLGDEHNINVLHCGAAQFADICDVYAVEPSNFTVDEFNEWKDAVADAMLKAQIEAEKTLFKQLLKKKNK